MHLQSTTLISNTNKLLPTTTRLMAPTTTNPKDKARIRATSVVEEMSRCNHLTTTTNHLLGLRQLSVERISDLSNEAWDGVWKQ